MHMERFIRRVALNKNLGMLFTETNSLDVSFKIPPGTSYQAFIEFPFKPALNRRRDANICQISGANLVQIKKGFLAPSSAG